MKEYELKVIMVNILFLNMLVFLLSFTFTMVYFKTMFPLIFIVICTYTLINSIKIIKRIRNKEHFKGKE